MRKKFLALIIAFVMVMSTTITAFATSADRVYEGFDDVEKNSWYEAGVKYCYEKGLMSGTSDTEFSPSDNMTRAQLAAVMWRASGQPEVKKDEITDKFPDVADNAYYNDAVYWCRSMGIMNGYEDNHFRPDSDITREQLVTILWRYIASPKAQAEDFSDEDTISPWASEAVDWARNVKVVAGKDNNRFDPQGNATRAEVATVFYRFIG